MSYSNKDLLYARCREIRKQGVDIYAAIELLNQAWWDIRGIIPALINLGDCETYAYMLQFIFPEADILWDDDADEQFDGDGAHCFIYLEGVYYDAEAPGGRDDWHDLPFYQEDTVSRTA